MRKNNDTYENEYTLLKNIDNNEQTTLFVYLGKIYTGSFIHKHGSACAYSMGGKRLWMLYNKTGMGLLNNKNLPKYILTNALEWIPNVLKDYIQLICYSITKN